MKTIISFSGGKDSTYLALTEPGELLFFDTGFDFPQMTDHLSKLQEYLGREIISLKPDRNFLDLMLYKYGWPSKGNVWCKRLKIDKLKQYSAGCIELIGFASDEKKRANSKEFNGRQVRFPMIENSVTGQQALGYCKSLGFSWGGLYDPGVFNRVSCFCCPNKRIGELRILRKYFPDLWSQMLEWEEIMKREQVYNGFHGDKGVCDLERRFLEEDRQMDLFPDFSENIDRRLSA